MEIRKAKTEEINAIMEIYETGKRYMRANGNLTQWGNGYPQKSLIERDISEGISYVIAEEDGSLAGVFAFSEGPDTTYAEIYEGAWPDGEPYSVIHRISTAVQGKGLASFVFNWCIQRCRHLRIDTHRDNIPMQKALLKNGFKYCGIIYLADGSERLAFQKDKDKGEF